MTSLNIDKNELHNFEKIADEWWDPQGKLSLLHQINPLRLEYIRDFACKVFHLDIHKPKIFSSLKILDLGCGGGLLSEPLARLGGQVTAIDAVEKNTKVAALHAKKMNIDINYIFGTVEQLPSQPLFDMVCCLEVIEHVPDPQLLIHECSKRLKPGGMLVLSTMNRNLKSLMLAKIAGEYILRWLPIGTHQWHKFIKPSEMDNYLEKAGVYCLDFTGCVYHPLRAKWQFSNDISVNYLCVAHKNT